MPEVDSIDVPLRVDDSEFNKKMDAFERRLDKAERKGKDTRRKSAFIGGAVGGAAGFVAGSVASSGPVSSIASVFGNILIAALAPLIAGLFPVLQGLSAFLDSPGIQKLIGGAGKGLEKAGDLITAAATNEGTALDRIMGNALTFGGVGAVAGAALPIPGVGPVAGGAIGLAGGALSETSQIANEQLRDEGYVYQGIGVGGAGRVPFLVPIFKKRNEVRGFPDPSLQG